MSRRGKREPLITINENMPPTDDYRSIKREKLNRLNNNESEPPESVPESEPEAEPAPKRARSARATSTRNQQQHPPTQEKCQQGVVERRVLRSQYLAVKNLINEEKEELCKVDSDKLQKLIEQVDSLHENVQRPREQVADAEALLEIANTFVSTVRSHSKEGFTPSDFVSCLINEFGTVNTTRRTDDDLVSIKWREIGRLVSPVLMKGFGCSTMVGPMKSELKQRKVAAPRRRGKTTEAMARPEELDDAGLEEKTDTDKNMASMFDILRRKKSVRLENLILNRSSFAQTVENLFALSFLVKDGRAEIAVDEKGTHRVSPKNAPPSNLVVSGEVVYNHFVFRFDYQDWKLMLETVPEGEVLMPHRHPESCPYSQADDNPAEGIPASPIRKFSRNRSRPLDL